MAETNTGRTPTIIVDAPFGCIQTGPPDRPEPPRVEMRRLDKAAVLRKFKWSEKDFELAQSCEFPAAMKRPPKLGSWTFSLVWPENVLDGWANKQREKAGLLLRLVSGGAAKQ